MPKFTLDNSFRFNSQNETMPTIHSESIERLLQKLSSADWLPMYAREGQIQTHMMGWKKMLFNINEVLEDAMKMQATNHSVNMWLSKLPNLAYDVEDLLDEFQTEAFQRPGEETSSLFVSMVMSKVKEVNARFQDIAPLIVLLGLKSRNVRRRLIPTSMVGEANVGYKQKVVIKIRLEDHISRSKALKTLVGVSGFEYVKLKGDDKNEIEVKGAGMDVVALTTLLRNKVGHAELLSVSVALRWFQRFFYIY